MTEIVKDSGLRGMYIPYRPYPEGHQAAEIASFDALPSGPDDWNVSIQVTYRADGDVFFPPILAAALREYVSALEEGRLGHCSTETFISSGSTKITVEYQRRVVESIPPEVAPQSQPAQQL